MKQLRVFFVALSLLGGALIGFVCMTGCRPSDTSSSSLATPADPEALALVGSASIPVDAFRRELLHRSTSDPDRYASLEARQGLLAEMIRFEILRQRAADAGYDRDPKLRSAFDRMVVSKYQADRLSAASRPAPTEKDIEQRYAESVDRFRTAEQRRGAGILIRIPGSATAAARAELMSRALEIRRQAFSGDRDGSPVNFERLAARHSDDQASRHQGGDLGWLKASASGEAGDRQAALAKSLFVLKSAGEIGLPVETPEGLWILKLVDIRPADRRPLAEVHDLIGYELVREREQEALAGVFRAASNGIPVQVNSSMLESIPVAPNLAVAAPPAPGAP